MRRTCSSSDNTDLDVVTGDIELLEAATTRVEILQRKRESHSQVAGKLYAGFLGGESILSSSYTSLDS